MSMFAKAPPVSNVLTVRVTQEASDWLNAEAKRRNTQVADIIREALQLYAERSADGSAGSNALPDASTQNVSGSTMRSPKKSTSRVQ